MKPPDCESYSEQLKKEKEFLFIPSMRAGMKIVLLHFCSWILRSVAPFDLLKKLVLDCLWQ